MELDKIKTLDKTQLEHELGVQRKVLQQLEFQLTSNQLKQTHKLREVKKIIAQILTRLNALNK